MSTEHVPTRRRPAAIHSVVVALGLVAAPLPGWAAEPLGPTLCGVLKQLVPEVKGYKPEGARAQLVMAMAEKYDADATRLRQVWAQIDQVTTATCPKDREAMLGIVRTKSLSEALR